MTIAKRRAAWVDYLTDRFHRITIQTNLEGIIVGTVDLESELYVYRDMHNIFAIHRYVNDIWDGSEAIAYSLAGLSDALKAMGAAMIPF